MNTVAVTEPAVPAGPAPVAPLLRVAGAHADIAGSRILRGVDLDVKAGEVVALMGRNGVGKTTTLRCITGLLPLRAGAITFSGAPLARQTPDVRARAGIAYVPQGRDIFPHLTVEENLRVPLVVHPRSRREEAADLDRVFGLFPILREMRPRKGGVLSGGQQQQLAIGRALLTRPRLLMLDEPTEGIQPSIIEHIGDTLKRLKSEGLQHNPVAEIRNAVKALKAEGGLAILLVEQYVEFCRDVADRFFAMDRGVVVAAGRIDQLTDQLVRTHLQV